MAALDPILKRLRLQRSLRAYQPHLAGAHALGMAQPGEPLRVCCHAPDPGAFRDRLRSAYVDFPDFTLTGDGCRLALLGTGVQIVGAPVPTRAQPPVRRLLVIVRLLKSLGPPLRRRVSENRSARPIEDTFATAMGVRDVLDLERASLPQLRERWRAAAVRPFGRTPTPPPSEPTPAPGDAPEAAKAAETADHLLKSPEALLKGRESRWVDATQLLRSRQMSLAQPPKKQK